MSDPVQSTTSAPPSTYTLPPAATQTMDLCNMTINEMKTILHDPKDYRHVGQNPFPSTAKLAIEAKNLGISADDWNTFADARQPAGDQGSELKAMINAARNAKIAGTPQPDPPEQNKTRTPEHPLAVESNENKKQDTVIQDNTAGSYVVIRGDTLSKIAKEHGLDLEDLIELNKGTISNPNRISVGQTIKLPQQERSVEIPADPGMSAQEEPTREEPLYEEPPHYEPHVPETPAAQTSAVQAPMTYAHLLPPEPEADVVNEEPVPVDRFFVVQEEVPDMDSARYLARSAMPLGEDELPNPYETVTINPDGSRQSAYLDEGSEVVVSLPPSGEQIIAQSLFNIGSAPLKEAASFLMDAGGRFVSTSKSLMARAQEQSSSFISGLFSERFVYRIGKGDTLTSIAKKHDVLPARLLWDNRDSVEGTRIKEGRLLTVNKSRMPESEHVQAGIYYSNAVRLDNPLIHPEMRRLAPELFKAFEENGYLVEIYSDFRTFERQAQLHKSNKWPAAPAGYSDHNWGLAVDIRLYRKSPNGSYVRLAAQSIPAEMAKHPAMTRELREKGLAWAGANDPMHFSVSTVNTDYGSMIARRREAINMIGAKEGQLTPAQQRIVMYYVRSYADNPSLPKEDRIRLAMNYSQDE